MVIGSDSCDQALATAWPGALTAARDESVAAEALVIALRSLGGVGAPWVLRRRAVRIALELGPAAPVDELPESERCAVGLARLGAAKVDDIAGELGCSGAEARRLLAAGLRRLAASRSPRPLALVA
jgi:hypothetical protein